jgi:hypothetical protein
MKRALLAVVGAICCLSAYGQEMPAPVDISRSYYLPQIPGLIVSPAIPENFNASTTANPRNFEMKTEDVGTLLEGLGLPPVSSAVTYAVEVPQTKQVEIQQCKVVSSTYQSVYEAVLSDKDFIHKASFGCRIRRVFGGCRPDSLEEMKSTGRLSVVQKGPENISVGTALTIDLENSKCLTDAIDQNSSYQKLKACILANDYTSVDCQRAVSSTAIPERKSGTWVVRFSASEVRNSREMAPSRFETVQLPPLQEQRFGEKRLTGLDLGRNIQLNFDQAAGIYSSGDIRIDGIISRFSGKEKSILLRAYYETKSQDGKHLSDAVAEADMPLNLVERKIANYPSKIVLRRADIIEVSWFVDNEQAKSIVESIVYSCNHVPSNQYLSNFGEWMCSNIKSDSSRFARHVEAKLLFKDQNQQLRSFTFERKAPALDCSVDGDGFSCAAPEDRNAWISDQSELLARVYDDPIYDDRTLIVFNRVEGFIPVGKLGVPLQTFITPQGHAVELKPSENGR